MALLRGGKLAATAAFRAHEELQSGELVKASNTLSSIKVDGYALAKEAEEIMTRMEAVENHYRRKEEAIAGNIGQLRDTEQRMEETKRSTEAELSRRRSDLRTHRSSLQEAENRLSRAKREQKEAEDKKEKMIGVTVGVGIAGVAFSIVTFGIGSPIAVAATGACAVGAVSFADDQKKAEINIQHYRQVIRETERDIQRCTERIPQIQSEISSLTQQISALKQEASRYHDERGEMKRLIAFVKEAQVYWNDFAAATQHSARRAEMVESLTKNAQEKRFFSFFTRNSGGKRQAMSLLEAWEEVQSMVKSGSEYHFQIDFECSRCGGTFRHLPYAHNMNLVCNSCNARLY